MRGVELHEPSPARAASYIRVANSVISGESGVRSDVTPGRGGGGEVMVLLEVQVEM